jgi:serine/threonine protein phosphatase 1
MLAAVSAQLGSRLLFGRLLGRKPAPAAPPSTGGRLIYAIGDVHGRLDVLVPLLRDIGQDVLAVQPAERPLLVFLGDYVDRGPASREVVDTVLGLEADGAFEVVAIKGNHEEALLQFLEDPAFGATWLDFGGGATLASYGVQPPAGRTDAEALEQARTALDAALPAAHRDFYRRLELIHVAGDYAFVHAGVRPGVALEDQAERDLLWIRQEFLNDRGPFGKVIVHGHTPIDEPQLTPHRLGIDTGAYATGVLTAVKLHGETQRVMQARVKRGG